MPKQRKDYPQIDGDQMHNTYTDLKIFQSHTDIVRLLFKIAETRFASAADDCLVIIWDLEVGQRVHVLDGHTRPVICISMLDTSEQLSETILLTGSSDKLICLWGVDTGIQLQTITSHQGPVRCLSSLNKKESFCAAGESLSIWNCRGRLLAKLKRTNEEDIQYITVLNQEIIVTAADKDLCVYRFVKKTEKNEASSDCIQLMAKLQKHPDSIRCLCYINDSCFASGSIDGTVVLWSHQHGAWHQLWEYVDTIAKEDNKFNTSIHAMIPLHDKCLVASVGNGYIVFDVTSGKILTQRRNAHKLNILHMQFIRERALLLTCGEDSTVRLWGQSIQPEAGLKPKDWEQAICHFLQIKNAGKAIAMESELLGECLGHSGPVHMLIQFGEVGFISCGADMLVMAWKDGRLEELKRREFISKLLADSSASVV